MSRDRVGNWQGVLYEQLAAAAAMPFSWDGWTCFDFAATVYVALTGKADPRVAFGTYATEREAVVAMARAGGPAAILTSVLGEPLGHPALAQRGDIVLGDFGVGDQPAVCAGFYSFAPGAAGLLSVKTLSASAAWAV